jgi:hypothetical protein
MTNKTIDLNIFYREIYTEEADWTEESDWYAQNGTTWAPTLTIDPYVYVEDARGTRKYETSLLIECTPAETALIAEHYPQDEYGSDWWDFAENFLAFAPPRIASLIKTIDVEEHGIEPNWWVAMAEEITI